MTTTKIKYGNGYFEKTSVGVRYVVQGATDDEPKASYWVCSPLDVTAETRDTDGGNWGYLLVWKDREGRQHKWAMPASMLQGDGRNIREELAGGGLRIGQTKKARELLNAYIQFSNPDGLAICVNAMGWHNNVFVLPHRVFGQTEDGEEIVWQSTSSVQAEYSEAGTLEDWRKNISEYAIGNSRFTFALSTAFAGPILEFAGEDSGGFHFKGASSTGKTTMVRAAASVWGGRRYMRTWRTTVNGLEAIAAMHNDGLLCLDELRQDNAEEAGEAAYMLANGVGKSRADRSGFARKAATWRLLFLSTGEVGLSQCMTKAKRKPAPGMQIRMVEIPIDAGKGMGGFEYVPPSSTPSEVADKVNQATHEYYGVAGSNFLESLCSIDKTKLRHGLLKSIDNFCNVVVPAGASSQVRRVARRFGLVAAAGEAATRFGITGWKPKDATKAAVACFQAWLSDYGTMPREERMLLEHVRELIEVHGSGRFEPVYNVDPKLRVNNRLGFINTPVPDEHGNAPDDEKTLIYVLPQTFKQHFAYGVSKKTAVDILIKHKWLIPGKRQTAQSLRIGALGGKVARVYVLDVDRILGR